MRANVTARAVLNYMSEDLAHAVADENMRLYVDTSVPGIGVPGMSYVYFWTLTNTNSADNRVARYTKFYRDNTDDSLKMQRWSVAVRDYAGYSYTSEIAKVRTEQVAPDFSEPIVLATDVREVLFHGWPPQAGGYLTNLPRAVHVRLVLERGDDVSSVQAWSAGPDGVPGNEDDIGNW